MIPQALSQILKDRSSKPHQKRLMSNLKKLEAIKIGIMEEKIVENAKKTQKEGTKMKLKENRMKAATRNVRMSEGIGNKRLNVSATTSLMSGTGLATQAEKETTVIDERSKKSDNAIDIGGHLILKAAEKPILDARKKPEETENRQLLEEVENLRLRGQIEVIKIEEKLIVPAKEAENPKIEETVMKEDVTWTCKLRGEIN